MYVILYLYDEVDVDGWMRDYLSNCGWMIRLPFRHLLPFEGEKKLVFFWGCRFLRYALIVDGWIGI
jgi:hypothetical protein